MRLTPAQVDVVKAWIIANVQNPTEQAAQAALNALASPAFKVYRPRVTKREIYEIGFDWTRLDNLTAGKARVWEDIFVAEDTGNTRSLNPSKSNVRIGINSVWVGTGADLAVRATVYEHCQRDARVAEKLLVLSGAGTAANATGDGPATLGFEGELTLDEVVACMP